jgi:hypothetical protein
MSEVLIALKCTNCGAPLQAVQDSEFIKCSYCGFTQKLIDSQQYVERLRGEVRKWLSDIQLSSNVLGVASSVDPIARHNLFVNFVKPKIIPIYSSFKSQISSLMSSSLIYLPFWNPPRLSVEETPRGAFEKIEQIESVKDLVVVEEDQTYFNDVMLTTKLYAYMIDALYNIRQKNEVEFIINNFKTMNELYDTYGKREEKKTEFYRLSASLKAYESIKELMVNRPREASMKARESLDLMNRAKAESRNPQMAYMIPSIEKDLKNIEVVRNLAEISSIYFDSGDIKGDFLIKMEKIFKFSEALRNGMKAEVSIYTEITGSMRDIVASKMGRGQVLSVPGDGDILVPMWLIPMKYTFITGSWFMKKGKEVNDVVLTSAVPASQPVTDIFLLSSGMGFFDRIKGKEETMSKGTLSNIVESAKMTSLPSSVKVLPPLIPRSQANRVYENYIESVRSRTADKIRLGVGEIRGLVYLPGKIQGGGLHIPSLRESQINISQYLDNLLEVSL